MLFPRKKNLSLQIYILQFALCTWHLALGLTTAIAADAPTPPLAGIRPTGADGQPLNLDFETGTLEDWLVEGEAFADQPVKGDTVAKRRGDMRSGHTGQFWIGGYERKQDKPQGTLTSAGFKVTHPFATFLVAGGPHATTCVQGVRSDSQKVIFQASGTENETLRPVLVDLSSNQGAEIYIRLVDKHSGHWGHVNFDDFRFHATRPPLPEPSKPPAADLYPFAGLSAEEAAKAMAVPEGFSVTAFAGEPDVMQPIAMAWDDRGRLWVAEAYSYPVRVPQEKARDRILIFEDADGDGRFDKRTVFTDKLNLVSGLEVGFGGVWVGAAPHLLFIPDKDGNDRPDGPPQVLLDGWGFEDTHETLNAFIWGPDGWLYGCHGVFTHSRVGKPGTPEGQRIALNAGIWRYHPTRHAFEVFAHGTSNPWGVDFNDHGQAFCTACVIPHLFHIIQGARYQRQAGQHFNSYTYDDIKTIARHRHWVGNQWNDADRARSDTIGGGHAHAGAMVYLGGSWPEKYRNQLFMNNIHGQRINQDLLTPKGSGYEGNAAPDFLMARDRWSQIINMRYGPDGQVYMIDWYDKNACHHRDANLHDRSNGRIFKITYGKPKPVQIDLKTKSDAELVELQLHSNDWYVRHARRLLQERGAHASMHSALKKMALEHTDETRRLRGLWALHVTLGLDDDAIRQGLSNSSDQVRAWTLQLAMERCSDKPSAELVAGFVNLAKTDPSPVVRLYLASAAGRMPLEDRWQLLRELIVHAEDTGDHNLPLLYWYAAEPLVEHDPKRALGLLTQSKIPLVVNFLVRRIAALGTPEAVNLLVGTLPELPQPDQQLGLLKGIATALEGRRQVDLPAAWPDVFAKLQASPHAEVRSIATALAVKFGDQTALASLRRVVADPKAEPASRHQALASLLSAKDAKLAPLLQPLLKDSAMAGAALRGLAAYDDPKTPGIILAEYARWDLPLKRDALATLASRTSYAQALLQAVANQRVPATDLSADLIRQLRNLKDADLDKRIAEVWGTVRESPAEKAKQIADYKAMLSSERAQPVDVALGRAIFVKTCSQCHTLFGTGGKVGPELTGSNRANLDYLLSNVLDPSAVMAKEYMPWVVVTTDGRIITGLLRHQDKDALTLQTANETLILPRGEIDEMQQSKNSMMPDDILKPLAPHEVRSLGAYLASPMQTPLLATPETAQKLFNGQDLSGWQGNADLWSVEQGQIVGRTTGLKRNEFLRSELVAGDFRFSCQVQLVNNAGNSGIQFRSEPLPGGEMKGYQADIGAGWCGKLYEEHGRALLWDKSGEAHVKKGEWNSYVIEARGSRMRTWINGQPCVDLDDPAGAKRGLFALQLHSGGPTEVRFKDLKLELISPAAATAGN